MKKFLDFMQQDLPYTRNDKWFYHSIIFVMILDSVLTNIKG